MGLPTAVAAALRGHKLPATLGGAVIAPMLVGLALLGVERATDPSPAEQAASVTGPSALELVDVAVTKAPAEVQMSDGTTADVETTVLDIALRNTSSAISIVDRVALKILGMAELETCSGEGGEVGVSATYPLEVGSSHAIGSVAEATTRQAVPANAVDRFEIAVGAPDEDFLHAGLLVHATVQVFHDAETLPLDGGNVVLSPTGISTDQIDPDLNDDDACVGRNWDALARFGRLDGDRHERLGQLLEAAAQGKRALPGEPAEAAAQPAADGEELAFDHPSWGASTLTVRAPDPDAALDGSLSVTDEQGRTVWDYALPWQDEVALHEPSKDRSGAMFIRYNPGRYDGVIVLRPTQQGLDDFGSLPPAGDYSGRYYASRLDDVDSDGSMEIVEELNDCSPDCASGTDALVVHRWDGTGYRAVE